MHAQLSVSFPIYHPRVPSHGDKCQFAHKQSHNIFRLNCIGDRGSLAIKSEGLSLIDNESCEIQIHDWPSLTSSTLSTYCSHIGKPRKNPDIFAFSTKENSATGYDVLHRLCNAVKELKKRLRRNRTNLT